MGIDNFHDFLKGLEKKGAEVIHTVHISEFSHKKVLYDISSTIYRYISSMGHDRWLNAIIRLILLFKKYHVHVTPVFDGVAPPEKNDEKKSRRDTREKSTEKLATITSDFENYKEFGKVTDLLAKTMKELSIKNYNAREKKQKSLLRPKKGEEEDPDFTVIDEKAMEQYIKKRENSQLDEITTEDIDAVKELLIKFGIDFLQAPEESESLCCYLVKEGKADAVMSSDSDCQAYGPPIQIISIDSETGDCEVWYHEEILDALELTEAQLRDMSIISGCDYNRKTKIKGIGPASAWKLIAKHKTIEELEANNDKFTDCDKVLHYVRAREIFTSKYPKFLKKVLYWNYAFDQEELFKYLRRKKLICDEEAIKKLWRPVTIVFEEDSD